MVKYGKTGKTNWGEYVFFYDKNGNILDKSQLYASALAVGKSFSDELLVPEEQLKSYLWSIRMCQEIITTAEMIMAERRMAIIPPQKIL